MTRLVVTDHPFRHAELERAAARDHGAEFAEFHCVTVAETIAAVRGADVVLVDYAPITGDVLAAMAPGASVIRYGVGYDNIDVPAAKALGVQVANVTGYGTETVADHAAAALFELLRRLGPHDRAIRRGEYPPPWGFGRIKAFADTSVGLVGVGKIGRALAERIRPFGFKLRAHDPQAAPGSLPDGIELTTFQEVLRCDAVSLHLPLSERTRHIVGAKELDAMGPDAVLVNTSRGGLVCTAALAAALSEGRVGGAALDVFEDEPLPADSPLVGLANVILTPHMAFYSEGSIDKLQRLAVDDAVRALQGKPLRSPV
ncbi:MAG: C-terminal binding protein [Bifidobacteriaceae bacterium]|jgi:D-3-phosphoglycerate dehydrogenase|nr:C-terminal binding protein [Bifidobacteriaceae bacterium]